MTHKQTIRAIAFFAVVLCLFAVLSNIFESGYSPIDARYKQFKNFEKDIVDGVYIGTSGVDRYWMAAKAFEDNGLAIYPLSSDRLPVWLYMNLIKEAYERQHPQLYIIDLRAFTVDYKKQIFSHSESGSRWCIDMLDPLSRNRIDAIRRSTDVMSRLYPDKVKKNDVSYWLPIIRFHSRWEMELISVDDLIEPKSEFLGFHAVYPRSVSRHTLTESSYSDVPMPLDDVCDYYLDEMLDYFDENDLNAVFVDSPRTVTVDDDARCKTLFNILDERGYPYITYNTREMREEYPFNIKEDFYNDGHTNFRGAIKFTEYFSDYLLEHYDFPDRRNDENYSDWHGVYDHLLNTMNEWEKKLYDH